MLNSLIIRQLVYIIQFYHATDARSLFLDVVPIIHDWPLTLYDGTVLL